MAEATLAGCPRLLGLVETDSTNRVARMLAEEGAPDGSVVWAERQTAGRGRHGRSWQSPPGNLYVSVVLRPKVAPTGIGAASFVVALAVTDAVRVLGVAEPRIRCKWPNDVLVDGRKVAGILLESEYAADGHLAWMIAGVGLNLRWHPPDAECLYPPTSLAAVNGVTDRDAALRALWEALLRWRSTWTERGFAPIRRAWLARAYGLSQPMSVRLDAATLSGVFTDIADDGALLLATSEGPRRVMAGDVFPSVPAT